MTRTNGSAIAVPFGRHTGLAYVQEDSFLGGDSVIGVCVLMAMMDAVLASRVIKGPQDVCTTSRSCPDFGDMTSYFSETEINVLLGKNSYYSWFKFVTLKENKQTRFHELPTKSTLTMLRCPPSYC